MTCLVKIFKETEKQLIENAGELNDKKTWDYLELINYKLT